MIRNTNFNSSPLRFAINLGNSVLAQKRNSGELTGITIALANMIAKAMNATTVFTSYDAAGNVVKDASRDVWDIAFLAIDPLREAELRFTQPYVIIEGTIMVPKNSSIKSVRHIDRVGNIINVGKNAAYDLFLSRNISKASFQRFSSSKEAIDMFIHGQGDMVAGIRQVLNLAVMDDGRFRVLPDSFTEIRQAICVPVEHGEMYEKVTSLLAEWQTTGVIQKLVDEYISSHTTLLEPKQ